MKIAVIWHFDKAKEIYPYWRDGLRAALEEIGKDHDVTYFLGDDYKNIDESFDKYLFWGDSNDSAIDSFADKPGVKGLILTTSPHDPQNLKKYNVIFCESMPVYEQVRSHGLRAVHAFGTDTDFFSPDDTEKDIPYFYPATFSPWKCQSAIAHYGQWLYCVGTLQPDGQQELQACLDKGVHVAQGYFKAEYIRDLYRRAREVPIPAIHGSERTILEAMSIDLFPTVNLENKAYAIIEKFKRTNLVSPREFVLKHYSHRLYAGKIMKGLST